MKKLCFLLLAVALFCAVGCKKEAKPEPEPAALWSHFTYPDYNAHIYLKLENNKAEAICCGSANKIVGRIRLTHDCTEDQFETLKRKIIEHGAAEEERVAEPAIEGYPDMTAYLSFFMSRDKQEEIWKSLVEE